LNYKSNSLLIDFNHLTTSVKAVCGIDAMRAEGSAISRIFGKFRLGETVCAATFARAGFGLFTFWLAHDVFSLEIKIKMKKQTEKEGTGQGNPLGFRLIFKNKAKKAFSA